MYRNFPKSPPPPQTPRPLILARSSAKNKFPIIDVARCRSFTSSDVGGVGSFTWPSPSSA